MSNFRPEDHRLLFHCETARCPCGKTFALFTTDTGRCTCGGFVYWAKTAAEIRWAFAQHLRYAEEQAQQAQSAAIPATAPAESLHELRWHDGGGFCAGCSWSLGGMSPARIEQAFQAHLTNLTGYKTY